MAYGDKRDNRKIDLYVRKHGDKAWTYATSTTWARTCKEAVANFQPVGPGVTFDVKARFAS
jgi:hypothetical protein